MANVILVSFSFINNDRIFEDMSSKIYLTLSPRLARVTLSVSSIRFETPMLVAGLMILKKR